MNNKLTASLMFAAVASIAAESGSSLPPAKAIKEKFKNRKIYSEEELERIQELSLDKSSPGRKALREYKESLKK